MRKDKFYIRDGLCLILLFIIIINSQILYSQPICIPANTQSVDPNVGDGSIPFGAGEEINSKAAWIDAVQFIHQDASIAGPRIRVYGLHIGNDLYIGVATDDPGGNIDPVEDFISIGFQTGTTHKAVLVQADTNPFNNLNYYEDDGSGWTSWSGGSGATVDINVNITSGWWVAEIKIDLASMGVTTTSLFDISVVHISGFDDLGNPTIANWPNVTFSSVHNTSYLPPYPEWEDATINPAIVPPCGFPQLKFGDGTITYSQVRMGTGPNVGDAPDFDNYAQAWFNIKLDPVSPDYNYFWIRVYNSSTTETVNAKITIGIGLVGSGGPHYFPHGAEYIKMGGIPNLTQIYEIAPGVTEFPVLRWNPTDDVPGTACDDENTATWYNDNGHCPLTVSNYYSVPGKTHHCIKALLDYTNNSLGLQETRSNMNFCVCTSPFPAYRFVVGGFDLDDNVEGDFMSFLKFKLHNMPLVSDDINKPGDKWQVGISYADNPKKIGWLGGMDNYADCWEPGDPVVRPDPSDVSSYIMMVPTEVDNAEEMILNIVTPPDVECEDVPDDARIDMIHYGNLNEAYIVRDSIKKPLSKYISYSTWFVKGKEKQDEQPSICVPNWKLVVFSGQLNYDDELYLEDKLIYGIRIGRKFKEEWMAVAEVGYQTNENDSTKNGKVLLSSLNLAYYPTFNPIRFTDKQIICFYATAGAGILRLFDFKENSTELAVNAGVGFDYHFSKLLDLNFDFRYYRFSHPFKDGTTQNIAITGGLSFSFH